MGPSIYVSDGRVAVFSPRFACTPKALNITVQGKPSCGAALGYDAL